MSIEIERRFIVNGDQWKNFSKSIEEFQQGYLSTNFEEWVVRIRIINKEKSKLTLKACNGSFTNDEFEYSIPLQDAQSILEKVSNKLNKTRYTLNYGPGRWVIDCFRGDNYPLILAEVELDSEQQIIEKPSWCNFEVTGIKKLSNAGLSKHPISKWSQEELKDFNLP